MTIEEVESGHLDSNHQVHDKLRVYTRANLTETFCQPCGRHWRRNDFIKRRTPDGAVRVRALIGIINVAVLDKTLNSCSDTRVFISGTGVEF